MNHRRRYRNPPIAEAICELLFNPGRDWDLTIPGRLHSELSDEYSAQPQQQKVLELGLEAQIGKRANIRYGEALGRVALLTPTGSRKVCVGPDALSIHMLRPYQDPSHPEGSGWDEFRPRVQKALEAYWKVAQPDSVKRIGVRYINKITVPSHQVDVGDYLNCALPDVDGLPDQLRNFMSRIDYTYNDEVRLVLSQGLENPPDGPRAFIVDLDVIWRVRSHSISPKR